ncbi:MAG: primosomal protein N' [Endozoicomonas sp. (ex Botrylloides leachii)]|nr:primosomal protein N' [Endozoicomonas sp. (ex Botrylloides leachii)]
MPAITLTENLFVQVAIPSPLRTLFDYLPPKSKHHHAIKRGVRVIVPFGRREITGIVISTSSQSAIDSDKLKPIITVLDNTPIIPEDIMTLCCWASGYYHYSLGETLMLVLPKSLRQGKSLPIITTTQWQLMQPMASIEQLQKSNKQLKAAQLLNQSPAGTLSETELTKRGISKAVLKNMAKKGFIASHEQPQAMDKFTSHPFQGKEQPLTLNKEQRHAIHAIRPHFNQYHPVLLDGITGSGKTEVYLQLIALALAAGKQTLVLIPEIGLTPQTFNRFKKRFSTPIICLHSKLSESERLQGWHQAANETASLIIATRSGVFTPLPSLGLIIVDEEHDASYKQQDTLRYNARDLALYRGRQAQCPVILGSATPSLESWYNARRARFQYAALKQRAGQASHPQMELLDMRRQNLQHGLAPDIIKRISSQLASDNQVMIFLNRRGYAPSAICHECGNVVGCPHCDAYMAIHRLPPHMHCHQCDFQTPIPTHCTSCKSAHIKPVGQGTERVEQTLSHLFPNFPVIRIDRDSARKKNALKSMLETINSGTPCILLGTQMLAKGHHFPKVTLVIILNADAGLFSADFRALERTGQLITQVAGRAGRGHKSGQVVIQTFNPQHTALQTLIKNDYSLYINFLFKEREQLNLPPFEHLAIIRAESTNAKPCEMLLINLRRYLEQQRLSDRIKILGPFPAAIEKRQNRFRWQLLIQSAKRAVIHHAANLLPDYLKGQKIQRQIRWSIDIDPQDMT